MMSYDKNFTLEELENDIWINTDFPTGLVKKCFELRRKKLKDFSPEELRIMITQNFSLEYLIPLAIETLSNNILTEGNLYAGDLLESVLNSAPDYWKKNKDFYKIMSDLVERSENKIETNESVDELIREDLKKAKDNFLSLKFNN